MKEGIHPAYGPAHVVCACGNMFWTRSTRQTIQLEICNACHPFFTGQQKLVDTAGRVERFQKRLSKASPVKSKKKSKATTRRSARRGVLSTMPRSAKK